MELSFPPYTWFLASAIKFITIISNVHAKYSKTTVVSHFKNDLYLETIKIRWNMAKLVVLVYFLWLQ